ncbi:hypothetical protein AB1Y20_002332 [Prymnesium parvum]|uniref:Uncharacterized protein n=1 Tax=Prymnesium parvum TaxID=97485 RepID=A0AB34JAT6_PRYPA
MAIRRKAHALRRLEAAHAMHMTAEPLHSRATRHAWGKMEKQVLTEDFGTISIAWGKMEKQVLTEDFGTISISGGSSSIVEQRNEYRCFRVLPPAGLDVYQDLEHIGVSQAKLGHLDCGQMFDEVCTIRSKCRLISRIIEPYQNGYVVKVNEFGWPTCEQVFEKVNDEWRPLTRPVRQYMMAHIERGKVGATWRRRVVSERGSRWQARTSIKAAAEASVRSVSVGKEGIEEGVGSSSQQRSLPMVVPLHLV